MNNDKLNELFNSQDKKSVDSFIQNNLSQEQQSKLNEVLNDKEKLNQILSSDQAKRLFDKLKKRD